MEEFDWLPTESTANAYPMEIIEGAFVASDGSAISIPRGKPLRTGWGETGSTRDVGEALKPIPATLEIQYFSYVEDTFYGGTFDLPQAEILERFQTGFKSRITGEPTTYVRIVVGLGTEGHVSVWVSGEGITHEVATFVAPEVDVAWDSFKGNSRYDREQLIQVTLADLLGQDSAEAIERGAKPDEFERWKQQYTWSGIVVSGETLDSMWLTTFNGESDYFDFQTAPDRTDRAVPKTASIEWHDAAGQRYGAKIAFDEAEAFKAFEKFANMKDADGMKLEFRIADTNSDLSIALRNDAFVYLFEKVDVDVFRRK